MHPDNALTFTGSFVYGQAIADLYTGLSGGATVRGRCRPTHDGRRRRPTRRTSTTASSRYTSDGVLHAIRWESYILGLQYYLPTPNRMFISANYSHMHSSDMNALQTSSNASKLFDTSDWVDGNLFVDANAAVRFGLEYAYFHQNYPRRLDRQEQPRPVLGASTSSSSTHAHGRRTGHGGPCARLHRSTTFSQSSHGRCGPTDICAGLGWVLP